MKKFSLSLIDIKRETNDTVTLVFRQPALKKLKYAAGQYITLIFKINGRRYLRPYSLSSTPNVDQNLEVTVKRIPNGIVSNYVHDCVQVGDIIEVLEAMGHFTISSIPSGGKVFLWAAGSGVTPIFSILKEILNVRNDLRPVLIYGSKDLRSTIFLSELTKRQIEFQFPLEVFLSKEKSLEHHFGRVDLGLIENKYSPDLTHAAHFICGPTALKGQINDFLKDKGVSKDLIFHEDFEVVLDPTFFNTIENQEVLLRFGGETLKIWVPKGKSILEASLNQNIDLPYSCQTGNCSTCKAKILSGKIKMTEVAQERPDLGESECLLCSSFPLNSELELEVMEAL